MACGLHFFRAGGNRFAFFKEFFYFLLKHQYCPLPLISNWRNICRQANSMKTDLDITKNEIDKGVDAIRKRRFDQVKNLYQRMGVNRKDRKKRTLLLNATIYGELELVKWAVSHDAHLDHQDEQGFGALHFAVQKGEIEIVELMLRSGISVDLQDEFGNTALWRGMMDNVSASIIELLLRYGADPDRANHYGVSPRQLLSPDNKNYLHIKNLLERYTK